MALTYTVTIQRLNGNTGAVSATLATYQTDGGVYDVAYVDTPGPGYWVYVANVQSLNGTMNNCRMSAIVCKR